MLMEVCLPASLHPAVCAKTREMRPGARLFSYADLPTIWPYYIVLYYIVLYHIILYHIVFYHIVLYYYIILYYIILYYIIFIK